MLAAVSGGSIMQNSELRVVKTIRVIFLSGYNDELARSSRHGLMREIGC